MMNNETLLLEQVKQQVARLPREQRAEVAKLLQQMKDVITSASDSRIASAALALFGAINNAAMATAREMENSGAPHE